MSAYEIHLIDSGYYDITPEQEREIEARDECERRGIDPDEICADGGVEAWMVVAKELAERPWPPRADCNCRHMGDCDGSCTHPQPPQTRVIRIARRSPVR
jgi:hypothetical protein